MSTKNLIDNPKGRPTVFNDRDGKISYEPRIGLAETLVFIYEVNDLMKKADSPPIHAHAQSEALRAVCTHMGWFPHEVSAAEQYAAMSVPLTAETTR